MKSILLLAVSSLMLLNSCRKTDEPQIPDGTKTTSVVPLITKDSGSAVSISAVDPATFTGKFTVGLYFKNGDQPQKFDIVVIKNNNKSIVKTIQADVTTFPTSLSITGAQLVALFNEPIVLGDNFEIGANITLKDGEVYEAFPEVGEAYGTNVNNMPGASVSITYGALCTFDATQFAGGFEVTQDDADLFGEGATVTITKVDESHISLEYPVEDPQPVVVSVDGANVASIDKQVIGNFGDGEGDVSAQSTPGSDDFVAPCDGILSLNIEYTVAAGSYGSYLLKLKKK